MSLAKKLLIPSYLTIICLCVFCFRNFQLVQIFQPSRIFRIPLNFENGILQLGIVAIMTPLLFVFLKTEEKVKTSMLDIVFLGLIIFSIISLTYVEVYAYAFSSIAIAVSTLLVYLGLKKCMAYDFETTLYWIHHIFLVFSILFVSDFFFSNMSDIGSLLESKAGYQNHIKKTISWVGYKNQTAKISLLSLMILFTTKSYSKQKTFSWAVFGLIGLHILIMGSRNAYLALLLFGIGIHYYQKPPFKTILKLGALISVPIGIWALVVGVQKFFGQLLHNSLNSRFQIWNESLGFFYDSPLIGIGAGQYNIYNNLLTVNNHGSTHNEYILYLTEFGILGTIPFLFIFYLLYRSTRTMVQSPQTIDKALLYACILPMLSLGFFSELKSNINPQFLFMIIWALIDYNAQEKFKLKNKYYNSFIIIAAGSILTYAILFQKEMNFVKTTMEIPNKHLKDKLNNFEKINNKLVSRYKGLPIRAYIGNRLFKIGEFEEAKNNLEIALTNYPNEPEIIERYIEVCLKGRFHNEAFPYIIAYLDVNPCSILYNNYLKMSSPFIDGSHSATIQKYQLLFNQQGCVDKRTRDRREKIGERRGPNIEHLNPKSRTYDNQEQK